MTQRLPLASASLAKDYTRSSSPDTQKLSSLVDVRLAKKKDNGALAAARNAAIAYCWIPYEANSLAFWRSGWDQN
jgi:hypothetical protein